MAVLGIYIMGKNQGKFFVVRPALPAFWWFSGVGVYGPNVSISFVLVTDNLAPQEYLQSPRDEGLDGVEYIV